MSTTTPEISDDREAERCEAAGKLGYKLSVTAGAEFARNASELAGSDETLRRVLLARLKDAYYRGIADEKQETSYYNYVWAREQRTEH